MNTDIINCFLQHGTIKKININLFTMTRITDQRPVKENVVTIQQQIVNNSPAGLRCPAGR